MKSAIISSLLAIETTLLALAGGLVWASTLAGRAFAEVVIGVLSLVTLVAFAAALLWVRPMRGHRYPKIAATAYAAPWLAASGTYVGVTAIAAWGASEAVAAEDGAQTAAAIAVAAILGQIGKVTEKAQQGLTTLTPSTVASRWVRRAYEDDFPSLGGSRSLAFIDAYRAIHDSTATLTPQGAFKGATISGWSTAARIQRFEVIAVGLAERHAHAA
jgi:hypothetical protein